jgi:hypothetical protein
MKTLSPLERLIVWLDQKPAKQYTLIDLGKGTPSKLSRAGRFTERLATFGGIGVIGLAVLMSPASPALAFLEIVMLTGPLKLLGYFTGLGVDYAVYSAHRAVDPSCRKSWMRQPTFARVSPDAVETKAALEQKAAQDFAATVAPLTEGAPQPVAIMKQLKLTPRNKNSLYR